MPQWLVDLAGELPMLALALGFIWVMRAHIRDENARRDEEAGRNAMERKSLHDTFLGAISTVSTDCHASQDRASSSLNEIAKATGRTGNVMAEIRGELRSLLTIAREK